MKLLYFKRTKKLNISFGQQGGFVNSGDIWSECTLDKTSSNNSNNITNNTSKPNIKKSSVSDKIRIAEEKCNEYGFTKRTEKFGECVLKLIEFK